jgi:hypothetical protein
MELHRKVQNVHAPGMLVNLGIEDLGGEYLWKDEGDAVFQASRRYVSDLVRLVSILGLRSVIDAVPESELTTPNIFNQAADDIYDPLLTALISPGDTNAMQILRDQGWKGYLPAPMVAFYMERYVTLYPHLTEMGRLRKLARYLAQSFARYRVGAKVKYKQWDNQYIHIDFAVPIPGMPAALAGRRIFLRTLPTRYSRTHLPPWRAKGYMLITQTDVTPKLTAFTDTVCRDLNAATAQITDGQDQLTVRMDYLPR